MEKPKKPEAPKETPNVTIEESGWGYPKGVDVAEGGCLLLIVVGVAAILLGVACG